MLQGVGEEEVGTGVACQSQFGEADNLHALFDGFGNELFGLLGVVRTVTYPQQRYGCCNTNKSKIGIHSNSIFIILISRMRATQTHAHNNGIQRYKKNINYANL